jgi:hypothetical protein
LTRFIEKIGQTLIQQSVIQPLDYSGKESGRKFTINL